MPHLRFDLNFDATAGEKTRFANAIIRHFSEIMDTGTDHVGVVLRCAGRGDLVFGRAAESDGRVVFLDADIRLGRSSGQKRRLALAIMGEVESTWGVSPRSVYVVFTEHDGENFQLSDRVLPSWSPGEDPLASATPRRRQAQRQRRGVRGGASRARRGRRRPADG